MNNAGAALENAVRRSRWTWEHYFVILAWAWLIAMLAPWIYIGAPVQ